MGDQPAPLPFVHPHEFRALLYLLDTGAIARGPRWSEVAAMLRITPAAQDLILQLVEAGGLVPGPRWHDLVAVNPEWSHTEAARDRRREG